MRTTALLAALVLLPAPLLALELSFSGPPPDGLDGREVKLKDGLDITEPVALDLASPGTALVRSAGDDEEASAKHPLYRLEWTSDEKDKAKLFPVTPAAEIQRLRQANDATTGTAEAQRLQNSVVMAYLKNGDVLRECMGPQKNLPEALTLYVTLAPGQPQATAVIQPEGTIAECVLAAKERGTYPAVKAPITARMRIALSH